MTTSGASTVVAVGFSESDSRRCTSAAKCYEVPG
jgi:hypothetical protein